MDDIQAGEVVEGGGSKDTVVIVQGLDVHHAKVQQLWRGQRSAQNRTEAQVEEGGASVPV